MASQIAVRLPDKLARRLRSEARRAGLSQSDLVRMALGEFLHNVHPSQTDRPADRVRHLLGSVASDDPELAERHRERLLEALRRGR